ncbi:hypothetical protein [Actinocrispum wychmicini]|nr:hypothetical protein [Actinocrispum wychmicini]
MSVIGSATEFILAVTGLLLAVPQVHQWWTTRRPPHRRLRPLRRPKRRR